MLFNKVCVIIFNMISCKTVQKVSLHVLAISTLLFGVMERRAIAESYGPISPGEYNWVRLDLSPGNYHVKASTLGDVDLSLYDATGSNPLPINAIEADGYDNMYFSADTNTTVQLKYALNSCFNPWGPCWVNINIYRID